MSASIHLVRFSLASLLAVAVLAAAVPAQAEPGTWLGSVRLAEGKDRDVVRLPGCQTPGNRRVRQLRVQVDAYRAELDLFRVFFYNGDSQELHVKQHFRAGDSSRWIDLHGKRRCIQRIVVVGDTDTLGWRPGKQARVSFFGR